MAIQFARARYIARSSGGSAVRSAAYNARDTITAERTGELYWFKNRDAPEHHEVLLPEGAVERFGESAVLWNAAEAAERRKDAQVAREIVLALPANKELTTEDRIALARSFTVEHFVSKGLAVQLDVHAPHGAAEESERANWHAHLLITTRRLEGEGFAAKKARDLDPEVRSSKGRARVADGIVWGELWREHQDRYFREHGLAVRVDALASHAQEHVGPVRMRRVGSEIVAKAEAIRQANQEAARDPKQVLAALTHHNATFTVRDMERFLAKHLDATEVRNVRAAIVGSGLVVPLYDREKGTLAFRYTTRDVREQESAAMAAAEDLARQKGGAVLARSVRVALAGRTLREDQAAAFTHATKAGGLKLIEGRAGTGKSYTLAAIHDAFAREGKRVIGLAPTNTVAQDMAQGGFSEARTVHAALFALKNGRDRWDRKTVLIVDEAAMLDTKITGTLLGAAREAGAKVILAGDDRQLASIERGGLFTELRKQHGSAVISEVVRQKADWQRRAARDLAEGRFNEAIEAFDRAGAISWSQTQAETRAALVAAWTEDGLAQPGKTRFVFAYTNLAVDGLNAELRQVCRAQGQLVGGDVLFEAKHGEAAFAVGDRVQFTATDKKLRIYNGNAGTIVRIEGSTITAQLDASGKPGREVVWDATDFNGFRHGYAGTIYKGQGKTLDRTYLYHTEHWRSAASYVALTRQRESAQVFVARNAAQDVHVLARQMARGEVRAASIAWATREEVQRLLGERRQAKEAAAQAAAQRRQAARRDRIEEVLRGRRPATEEERTAAAEGERLAAARAMVRERLAHDARGEDPLRAKVQAILEARRQEERQRQAGQREEQKEGTRRRDDTERTGLAASTGKERAAVEHLTAEARPGRVDHPAQAAPQEERGVQASPAKEGSRGRDVPDQGAARTFGAEAAGSQAERPVRKASEGEQRTGRGEAQERRVGLDEAIAKQRAELARMRSLLGKDRLRTKVRAALEARRREKEQQKDAERAAPEQNRGHRAGQPKQEWLIAPYVSSYGWDSRMRGLSPANIASAIHADKRVWQAEAALRSDLGRAYRDSKAAGERLDALVKAEGRERAAARLKAQPEALGDLQGKDGFFTFRATREERARALAAVRGATVSLGALTAAERQAEKDHRADVAAQLARDKVGIPKLSAEATKVLEAVHVAARRGLDEERLSAYWQERINWRFIGPAWAEAERNPTIGAEITRFRQAAEERLGPDGLTALGSAREGETPKVRGLGAEPEAARALARDLHAARIGPAAYQTWRAVREREREEQRERQNQREGRGRGMHM